MRRRTRSHCVLFRVDAGPDIGLGHLQRCLSLAEALAQRGIMAHFVIRGTGIIHNRIGELGLRITEVPPNCTPEIDLRFTLDCLEQDGAHVAVVDSRNVGCQYLWELRRAGHFVVSIDDFAEVLFPTHLVVNGNFGAEELTYRSATGDTYFLLGTRYVMLRREFWDVPRRAARENVNTILLTLGGEDRQNLMPRLLKSLDVIAEDFSVIAIVGPFFDNHEEVEKAGRHSGRPVRFVYEPRSVRDLMLSADMAISGGGQTLYELACVGCPTVALQVAADQQQHLRALVHGGVVRLAEYNGDGELIEVRGAVSSLLKDSEARAVISTTGQRLVDGQGALRVAQAIIERAGLS